LLPIDGPVRTLFFLCLLFAAGVSTGAYAVRFVESQDLSSIAAVFEDLNAIWQEGRGEYAQLAYSLLKHTLQTGVALFALGFTMLAPMLSPCLLAWQGFSMGFAACSILSGVSLHPYRTAMAHVLLHNMLLLPLFLLMGAESIRFSWRLICQLRHPHHGQPPLEKEMGRYFIRFFVLLTAASLLCLLAAWGIKLCLTVGLAVPSVPD
jgi:uncharacterized membrane protein SpoIIM required for sporulation